MKTFLKLSATKIWIPAAIMLLFIGVISSCKKNSPPPVSPGTNEVWMQNTAFTPSSITVAVNRIITWTNKDGVTHNVTSNSGAFSSGNIIGGGIYTHQFSSAGNFPYKCTIHPSMNGTVIVQ